MASTELLGVTGVMVRLALNAATTRHMVAANNIANANTPGYTPMRVEFEEQLAEAVRSGALRGDLTGSAVAAPRVVADGAAMGPSGSQVQLDVEAARLAQNVLHYQALLRGLRGQMDILQIAISEGKA